VEEAILGAPRWAETSDSRAFGRLLRALDRVRKAKVLEQREGCNMQGAPVKMRGVRTRVGVASSRELEMTKEIHRFITQATQFD
jgi:hypothetical protein